jgi:hypothetical protein
MITQRSGPVESGASRPRCENVLVLLKRGASGRTGERRGRRVKTAAAARIATYSRCRFRQELQPASEVRMRFSRWRLHLQKCESTTKLSGQRLKAHRRFF